MHMLGWLTLFSSDQLKYQQSADCWSCGYEYWPISIVVAFIFLHFSLLNAAMSLSLYSNYMPGSFSLSASFSLYLLAHRRFLIETELISLCFQHLINLSEAPRDRVNVYIKFPPYLPPSPNMSTIHVHFAHTLRFSLSFSEEEDEDRVVWGTHGWG